MKKSHMPLGTKILLLLLLVLAAFWIGKGVGGKKNPNNSAAQVEHGHGKEEIWTCSMHPQIRMPKPGKCPICGMDLIVQTEEDGDGASPNQLSMSEAAAALANIETQEVERKWVQKEIRMVGKIDYDESRLKVITARVGGRLDRLFVDYTGISIKKGDHLVSLYSPELYAAQEELIQALNRLQAMPEGQSGVLQQTTKAMVTAAREKLKQWGLTSGQISEIESRKIPEDHLTMYSPISGIVIEKSAVEGNYVKTGTAIYKIADLSSVWVLFDAYESDISWLRFGQKVEFTVEAYPGEKFEGRIGFIDPILNPMTRTIKLRVNVENPNNKLKPDMYVRGNVLASLTPEGGIVDDYLAGKWISPMHPEVISSKPGNCTVCGMKLVKASSLGFVSGNSAKEIPLVIPQTAALITGKRAVVYVALPGDKPLFEGREVVLGPKVGDYYIVVSGLSEGEKVVKRGAFKIDSELQIRAKKSMMNPDNVSDKNAGMDKKEGVEKNINIPEKSVQTLVPAYLGWQHALFKDQLKEAIESKKQLIEKAKALMKELHGAKSPEASIKWIHDFLDILGGTGDKNLEAQRRGFFKVSNSLIEISGSNSWRDKYFRIHCPMAFDGEGADWLQEGENVRNPYFGKKMPSCGSVVKE